MPELVSGLRDGLIPTGIRDVRARAYLSVLRETIAQFDSAGLDLQDFSTVDVKLLPILVRGYSIQEWMFEGITEEQIRVFLANAVALHQSKSSVDGVQFALSLVGIETEWEQWWEAAPKRAANTHRARILNPQSFIPSEQGLGPKTFRAISRLVSASQRHSQDITLELRLEQLAPIHGGVVSHGVMRDRRPIRPTVARTAPVHFGAAIHASARQGRPYTRVHLQAPRQVAVFGVMRAA